MLPLWGVILRILITYAFLTLDSTQFCVSLLSKLTQVGVLCSVRNALLSTSGQPFHSLCHACKFAQRPLILAHMAIGDVLDFSAAHMRDLVIGGLYKNMMLILILVIVLIIDDAIITTVVAVCCCRYYAQQLSSTRWVDNSLGRIETEKEQHSE